MKKRIKRVPISPEVLLYHFTQNSAWRTYEGIPQGAVLKGATFDPYVNVFFLFVEHPSFEPVDVYAPVPLLDLEFLKLK